MRVTETFFSLEVRDMQRATAFYVGALGADVTYASERWSSLSIAGVRVGLFLHPEHPGGRVGLHFAVDDRVAARAARARAARRVGNPPHPRSTGVGYGGVADPEGNTFTLRG